MKQNQFAANPATPGTQLQKKRKVFSGRGNVQFAALLIKNLKPNKMEYVITTAMIKVEVKAPDKLNAIAYFQQLGFGSILKVTCVTDTNILLKKINCDEDFSLT